MHGTNTQKKLNRVVYNMQCHFKEYSAGFLRPSLFSLKVVHYNQTMLEGGFVYPLV